MKTVDARGLSCPQPVLLTLEAIKERPSGEITILVDTDTPKENVIRAATSQGWEVVEVQEEDMEYRIRIRK